MAKSDFNKKFDLEYLKKKGLIKTASEITAHSVNQTNRIKDYNRESFTSLSQTFKDGEYIETPYKKVFKVEKKYPPETEIGTIKIQDFFKYINNFNNLCAILGKNHQIKGFQLKKLLFFDVESTGLTSGAGNMVFLIGLGFFDDQQNFIIRQYFIDDYINERGLLYILENLFKKRYHLISFNGRTFDFYVLQNRFILSRKFSYTLDNLLHFDLLHSSRRVWKNMYSEFSLNHLEKESLKFHRTEQDIPGYLIPEYYKDYLKTGNAKFVEKIFYHNLMDVRSMLGLLILQIDNLDKILHEKYPNTVNYNSIASLLYNDNKKMAIKILNYCYKNNINDPYSIAKQLYIYYKKDKRLEKYQELLNYMIENEKEFQYFPYCELCKFYEHISKEYKKSIDILTRLKSRVNNFKKINRNSSDHAVVLEDIEKRLKRLNKKNQFN